MGQLNAEDIYFWRVLSLLPWWLVNLPCFSVRESGFCGFGNAHFFFFLNQARIKNSSSYHLEMPYNYEFEGFSTIQPVTCVYIPLSIVSFFFSVLLQYLHRRNIISALSRTRARLKLHYYV